MPSRAVLPPPPPPAAIRSWPDRPSLLADRAAVLGELVRLHVGGGRLALLLTWGGVAALGWAAVGAALIAFQESLDPISDLVAVVLAFAGIGLLVPAAVFFGLGAARARKVRVLLTAWGALDRDPDRDPLLRMPGLGLAWLLISYALCAAGLFTCVAVPASATPGEDTYGLVVLGMGAGLCVWITGLTGAVTALSHRRWVLRVLTAPAPAPVRQGEAAGQAG
ncbi:hypothetical protein [Streptomyces sp. AM 2-1-1]|uniref:hypothetical protein n=1 Tax=Streptomyces sp. AM 2-1-1 TaxID=3028709 RepID=UPI0023B970E1|nr:hypothetical protein [Streptomyces sp. AM 2-1-1]WEH41483.1 hypothetical protein PZB77_19370 [Streptomyces sp. AM 2-1-1]